MFRDNIEKQRILKIFTIFLIASIISSVALFLFSTGNSVEEMWRAEIGQQWRKEEGIIYASTPNERGVIAFDVNGNEMWNYNPDNSLEDIGEIRRLSMGKDGNVHAIYNSTSTVTVVTVNSNGQEVWSLKIEGYDPSSPAIAEDGTIYFIVNGRTLVSIGPDGSQRWYYETEPLFDRAPIIGDDGTVYITSREYYLHAINPDGTLKWQIPAGFPVTVKNDIIYYVDTPEYNKGVVVALDSDGDEIWKYYFQGIEREGYITRILFNTLSVIDDDIYIRYVYCRQEEGQIGIAPCPGPYWGVIIKLDSDGLEMWYNPLGTSNVFLQQPVIGDDTVFIGGWDYRYGLYSIYAIDIEGEVKQSYQFSNLTNAPFIDERGMVYLYEPNNLSYYTPEGEVKWEFTTEGELEPRRILREDNSMFFRCTEGYLYAIKEEKIEEYLKVGLFLFTAILAGTIISVFVYQTKEE